MTVTADPREFLWPEKYRPSKIDDVILPAHVKTGFKGFIKEGELPNILMSGGPGIGKTTLAKAALIELDREWIMINGSLDGNIDTLRTKIKDFVSTVSFSGGRKYVIIDEGDFLTHAVQPALRNFIEEYSHNAGFILTCNIKSKIMEPLQSRFSVGIDLKIAKEDAPKLAGEFLKRVQGILESEGVEYDTKVLVALIMKRFPDFRKVLGELQGYAKMYGSISTGILTTKELAVEELVGFLKEKSLSKIRQYVAENSDYERETYRSLYEKAFTFCTPDGVAVLIDHLARGMFESAFVADPEINMTAVLNRIAADVEFTK